MTEGLIVAEDPPILSVTLARGKANTIDAATSRAMGEVFTAFRNDPAYRVAILTGAGDRFFSGGWDLEAAAGGEAYESDYGAGGFGGFVELPDLTKPVIAAVNGIAAGGGFEIVMAANMAVAADHARFLLPEAKVGIIPDAGTVRLPRLLPAPLATEVLMGTRRLTAGEALHYGIVNRVVPAAGLQEAARDLAAHVIEAAPLAVAAILDLMRRTDGLSIDAALALMRSGDCHLYERMLRSEDAEEGPRAFLEKRPPRWQGR